MRPTGVWAELFRARFALARKRAGLGKPKFDLDCSHFRRPSLDGQLVLILHRAAQALRVLFTAPV